jgi:hypothetical protein
MPDTDPHDDLGVDLSRVPPPVGTGVSTGAPDDLFGTLGVDPSRLQPAPPARSLPFNVVGPSGDFMTDVRNRLGTAAATAATAVGTQAQGYNPGTPTLGRDAGGRLVWTQPQPQPKTQEGMVGHALSLLGTDYYQPQTEAGRLGQAALTALPFAAMDPAALPAVLGGAVAGQGATDVGAPPLLSDLLGLGGGAVGAKLANVGANLVLGAPKPQLGPPVPGSPEANFAAQFPGSSLYKPPMDAETARLAQEAKNQGIDLNVSQLSGDPLLKTAASVSSRIPFSGADNPALGQFTNATARSFGEDAPRLTPEVFQRAAARLGTGFNDIAQRTTIPMSNNFLTTLQNYITQKRGTTLDAYMPVVEKQVDNIIDTAANNNGDLGGRAYLDLTQKGGMLDNLMNNDDPAIRKIGIDLRGIVDQQFQQSAQPGDAAALLDLRRQWRNMKTVQPLLSRADAGDVTPSTGIVSPAALRQAVNNSWGADTAATMPTGTNMLNDLARVGQRFLKEPPSSMTPERTQWVDLLKKVGEPVGALAAGAAGAHYAGLDFPTAVTALTTAGAGLAANRYLAQPLFRLRGPVESLVQSGLSGGAPGPAPYFPGVGLNIGTTGLSNNQRRLLQGP